MTSAGPRAVIFDFNGVIADDEHTHFMAFQQALSECRFSLTAEEYYEKYLGMDERTCAATMIRSMTGQVDADLVDRITLRKAALFQMLTATQKPVLFPGVVESVKRLGQRCRLAIASGGRREQIEWTLKDTPIEHDFAVLVSAEDAPTGKPDPAIYHITLDKLNRASPAPQPRFRSSECLVIEDTLAGVHAARAAGMPVVAVATTYQAHRLGEAALVLHSLKDLDWSRLAPLFQ
jgi:beta-phosphoglucomutase-like phosphatase (HAD superfamily)